VDDKECESYALDNEIYLYSESAAVSPNFIFWRLQKKLALTCRVCPQTLDQVSANARSAYCYNKFTACNMRHKLPSLWLASDLVWQTNSSVCIYRSDGEKQSSLQVTID